MTSNINFEPLLSTVNRIKNKENREKLLMKQ